MNAERELRDLIDERVRAVRERDSATLGARPAEDVITFDVLPPPKLARQPSHRRAPAGLV